MKDLEQFKETLQPVVWEVGEEGDTFKAEYSITDSGEVFASVYVGDYWFDTYTLPNSTLFLEDGDCDLSVQFADIDYEFKESFEEWGYKHVR